MRLDEITGIYSKKFVTDKLYNSIVSRLKQEWGPNMEVVKIGPLDTGGVIVATKKHGMFSFSQEFVEANK